MNENKPHRTPQPADATISDAQRRAELLRSRYAALTDIDTGRVCAAYMREWEWGIPDGDSITSALVEGDDRLADLQRLMRDGRIFQVWRLRLEHPRWWVGCAPDLVMLAQFVSELSGDRRDVSGFGPWPVVFGVGPMSWPRTGYVGANWVRRMQVAIEPLSSAARVGLGAALHRELMGRQVCMSLGGIDDIDRLNARLRDAVGPVWEICENADPAVAFPESEAGDVICPVWEFWENVDRATAFIESQAGGVDLTGAVEAVRKMHGREWADAFTAVVEAFDPIIWPELTEALMTELHVSPMS